MNNSEEDKYLHLESQKWRIPCRTYLAKMEMDLDSVLCPRYGNEIETVDHALVNCSEVKTVWQEVGRWWGRDIREIETVQYILQSREHTSNTKSLDTWTGVKWAFVYLLSHRNKMVFKNES